MRKSFRFPLPEAAINEEPLRQICVNESWMPILISLVEHLEWASRWADGTDMNEVERNVALLYYAMVNEGACAEMGADQNETILAYLQALEGKLDATLPMLPTPEFVPDETWVTDSSTTTATEQYARMVALCRVVYAFLGSIAIQAAEFVTDEIAIGLIATAAASIIGSPIVGAVVGAAFAVLTQAQIAALGDRDAWDEVVCCMRDNLVASGEASFENFQHALDACAGLSINAELIRELIAPLLTDVENYNRFLRALSDEYVRAQQYPESVYDDCGCSTCGEEFNFRTSPFGTTWASIGGYTTWAKYVPGEGWQALLYPYSGSEQNRYVMRLYVKCDEEVDVNIIYFNMSGGGGGDDLLFIALFDDDGNQVWSSGGLNYGVCADCIRSVVLPAGSYVGNTIRFLQSGTTLAERVTIHRVSVNTPLT